MSWNRAIRLIETRFPPIALFEDIADPANWDLLAAAEGKTNPRLAASVGQLDRVPPERRVSGPGASYVMAPFVHCSPDRPGRFHTGDFGAYYAASSFETALAETVHHQAKRLRDSADRPGWISDMRELVGTLDAHLADLRGGGEAAMPLLDPEHYDAAQLLAQSLRSAGSGGIVYPSVRDPGGECATLFWPDIPAIPVQGRHLRYHWDGQRIDMIQMLSAQGGGQVFRLQP